jgi:hypothetical protein
MVLEIFPREKKGEREWERKKKEEE